MLSRIQYERYELFILIQVMCPISQVFVLDTNRWTPRVITSIASHNHLDSRIKVIGKSPEDLVDSDVEGCQFDVIVSDMWFQTLNLPWDGLYYSYALRSLEGFLKPGGVCLPRQGVLKGMCLWMRVRIERRRVHELLCDSVR